jgi:cyclin-dependent kinase-like
MFPGEDEIDQLYQIQKLVGDITPIQKTFLKDNPKFLGIEFP